MPCFCPRAQRNCLSDSTCTMEEVCKDKDGNATWFLMSKVKSMFLESVLKISDMTEVQLGSSESFSSISSTRWWLSPVATFSAASDISMPTTGKAFLA